MSCIQPFLQIRNRTVFMPNRAPCHTATCVEKMFSGLWHWTLSMAAQLPGFQSEKESLGYYQLKDCTKENHQRSRIRYFLHFQTNTLHIPQFGGGCRVFFFCFLLLLLFFSSVVSSKYLSIFSLAFIFSLWSAETAKPTKLQVLFFSLINNLLTAIRWSVCISKSKRISRVSFG